MMSRIPNPLGDSSRESRESSALRIQSSIRLDDIIIFLMVLPIALAAFLHLLNSAPAPESPKTRDIHLTVPETSRVDAQVTSDNNTINLQNL